MIYYITAILMLGILILLKEKTLLELNLLELFELSKSNKTFIWSYFLFSMLKLMLL